MPKIILPGQNVAIQTPQSQIEPLWYEKLKGWEAFINLLFAGFPTGAPLNPAPIHASLGADQAMNSGTITVYFNGPSVAQGSTGTWWASGTITVVDTAAQVRFNAKLWDGTTVVASAETVTSAANLQSTISLSGYLALPTGNLRIDCSSNSAASKMVFNASGNSKDCTISAFRIA
jgi:hypothetical protein